MTRHRCLLLSALATLTALAGCSAEPRPGKVSPVRDPPNYPCEQSLSCKRFGWCKDVGGDCQASSNEDCKNSELCKKSGLCSQEGPKCIAKEGDCAQSEWCKNNDLCDALEGVCK